MPQKQSIQDSLKNIWASLEKLNQEQNKKQSSNNNKKPSKIPKTHSPSPQKNPIQNQTSNKKNPCAKYCLFFQEHNI